jgi:RNA polymerase sigma factor (sigma-70 family)
MSTKGQQEAFLERVDRHRGILLKVGGAYCRAPEDREDLAQETIAQLWRSYPRFDGRVAFSTWMYRIAVNVAISFYRGERRRLRAVPTPESVLERVPGPHGPERDDRLDLIHELIEQLEPLDRALMLFYLDDYSYAEIAALLGISESNCGTKIGRIKERLKRNVTVAKQL